MPKRKVKDSIVGRKDINEPLKRIHRSRGVFYCACGIYRSKKKNLIHHLSQEPDCVSRLLKIEFDKGETSLYKYSSLSSLENNICHICVQEFVNDAGVGIHKSKAH